MRVRSCKREGRLELVMLLVNTLVQERNVKRSMTIVEQDVFDQRETKNVRQHFGEAGQGWGEAETWSRAHTR